MYGRQKSSSQQIKRPILLCYESPTSYMVSMLRTKKNIKTGRD